jgi:alkylhydroperoxidase/carboxymuconolactone decarboxylase family protein YurZ
LREGQVSRKLKELVLVGINVAERYPEGVRIHIEGARAYGATDAELAECHLTAVLTAGIPAWFEGSIFLG